MGGRGGHKVSNPPSPTFLLAGGPSGGTGESRVAPSLANPGRPSPRSPGGGEQPGIKTDPSPGMQAPPFPPDSHAAHARPSLSGRHLLPTFQHLPHPSPSFSTAVGEWAFRGLPLFQACPGGTRGDPRLPGLPPLLLRPSLPGIPGPKRGQGASPGGRALPGFAPSKTAAAPPEIVFAAAAAARWARTPRLVLLRFGHPDLHRSRRSLRLRHAPARPWRCGSPASQPAPPAPAALRLRGWAGLGRRGLPLPSLHVGTQHSLPVEGGRSAPVCAFCSKRRPASPRRSREPGLIE